MAKSGISLYEDCMLNRDRLYLLKEWDYKKNNVSIYEIDSRSCKKVWWICPKGHSYDATLTHRNHLEKPTNCPYCSNLKTLVGYNDLATTHPELVKEWNFDKNIGLSPKSVKAGTHQKVWWKCKYGHEWQAQVSDRAIKKSKCPYCAGRKALKGVNDLESTRPDVAKEWHPVKNGDLKPDNVTTYSEKKVWWLGKCGHEWEATVVTRTSQNAGCPYCKGHAVLKGFNDLATTHPMIAKEWHPTKNGSLKPSDVKEGSSRKVWWQDELGHEWEGSIFGRTHQDAGCPYCKNLKVLPGFNDLLTLYPDIAKLWHPTKNGDLKPTDVTPRAYQRVWWQDESGKEYYYFVSYMVNKMKNK